MRWTATLIPTLKETSVEADSLAHRLLLRAGLARKVAAGLYAFLPLGHRALQKSIAVIREELNRVNALEISTSALQPAGLREANALLDRERELFFKVKDRADREWLLGASSLPARAALLAAELRSYRQLPKNFYEIRVGFRDEARPRFGLMQAREFVALEGCRFDVSEESARTGIQEMHDAYARVFRRCGLSTLTPQAGAGALEFMFAAEAGDREVVFCETGQYFATRGSAVSRGPIEPTAQGGTGPGPEKFATPGVVTIEGLAGAPYDVPAERQIKTLVYRAGDRTILALVRGDDQLSEPKLAAAVGTGEIYPAAADEIVAALGAHPGSLGAVGVQHLPIHADLALRGAAGMTTGANEDGFHLRHVDFERDIKVNQWADLRTVKPGELCVTTAQPLSIRRAFGLGNLLRLGTGFSEKVGAFFLDESGQRHPCAMACYRLEIARLLQAVIEHSNDRDGIVWPLAIAPYQVLITPLGVAAGSAVMAAAERLYRELSDLGLEVLLDDRDERPGVKFKDADLIGIPFRVGIGEKSLAKGEVEIKPRTGAVSPVKLAEAAARLLESIPVEYRRATRP